MPGARHISHIAEGRANWQVTRPGRVKVGSSRQGRDVVPWLSQPFVLPHRPAPRDARTSTPRVIDSRGTLNAGTWRDAGWTVRALGRP